MRSFKEVLISKLRSYDAHGVWKNVDDDKLLTRYFVLTKEDKKKIDVFAAISPETVGKIRLYYEAVAQTAEESTGRIVVTVLDINTEGFGRALLVDEDYILLQKVHRNAHKFGFGTLEEMAEDGEKLSQKAIENTKKFGLAE